MCEICVSGRAGSQLLFCTKGTLHVLQTHASQIPQVPSGFTRVRNTHVCQFALSTKARAHTHT